MGAEFHFGEMKKFRGWMMVMVVKQFMPLNCAPEMAKVINFVLCIFCHNEEKLNKTIWTALSR